MNQGAPPPPVASFATWMQPKRRIYRAALIVCAISGLLVPLAMHWMEMNVPGTASWAHAPVFEAIHEKTGIAWWALGWMFALAWPALAAAIVMACEWIAFRLRIDRGDHAWSSMVWTLSGWRSILVWVLLVLAALGLSAAFEHAPGLNAFDDAPGDLLKLAMPFFAWNAANLVGPNASWRWRPRWPGTLPMVLVALGLVSALTPNRASIDASPQSPGGVALAILALGLLWFFGLALEVLWLNRSRIRFIEAARRAWRTPVVLARLLLYVRWVSFLLLLGLPLLPVGLLLVIVVPQMEAPLGCCGSDDAMLLVRASRFAVSWWWMVALGAAGALAGPPYDWINFVSSGRLLVEMGVVQEDARQPDLATPEGQP